MSSIVSIPGKLYAYYDPDTRTITGWGFSPSGADAGYFGPSAVYEDNADPRCDVDDYDGPFMAALEACFTDDMFTVCWMVDGWEVDHKHTLDPDDDSDVCACGQLLCPDTHRPVNYSPTGPVSYWHQDGTTCFLHRIGWPPPDPRTWVPCVPVPGQRTAITG